MDNLDTDNELEKLLEVIKPEPTLIFCEKRTRVDKVCEFLRSKEIKNLPFYDDQKMNGQMRHATLSLF